MCQNMESACTYLMPLPSESTSRVEVSDWWELDSQACILAARGPRRMSSGFYLVEARFIMRGVPQTQEEWSEKTLGSHRYDKWLLWSLSPSYPPTWNLSTSRSIHLFLLPITKPITPNIFRSSPTQVLTGPTLLSFQDQMQSNAFRVV